MTGYYDLILGLIPVSLLGLSGVLFVAGFSLSTAVTAGGLLAVTIVGHGMFVNEPVVPQPESFTENVVDSPAQSSNGFESAD